MKTEQNAFGQLRILSLDGSDIFKKMHRISGECGLTVKNEKGEIDVSDFKGYLDESLDTVYTEGIYSRYKSGLLTKKFRFSGDCTVALVNVTFKYAVKEFSRKGNVYVRYGYEDAVDISALEDHICVWDNGHSSTLIAIEVSEGGKKKKRRSVRKRLRGRIKKSSKKKTNYAPVKIPRRELLGDSFVYDEKKKVYRAVDTKNKTLFPRREIRKELYLNGFTIDGVKYVRYKRSAGSSRDGHCLFIAEPLYRPMMEWSSCGLDGEKVEDQASWQAYISLTLSSIKSRIFIPKKSILIIKDQDSIFEEEAVNVCADGELLSAGREKVLIKNKIWDGEALLDVSVFNENGYGENGMLLLRNRFFKTCAFNTNLQKWFSDNGITRLNQLSGHYYAGAARRIEDIKLVITESSLKYLKFFPKEEWEKGFDRWIEMIFDSSEGAEYKAFGVVKFDKETGPMNNRMVNTNYQLLNTLGLSPADVDEFLEPSRYFFRKIQSDPLYLRRYTNLHVPRDDKSAYAADRIAADNYRQHVLNTVMRLSDKFEYTEFYKNYRKDICKNFKRHLREGRVYTEGNYQTILGNGMEFLRAVIDKNYTVEDPIALNDGEVFTYRFPDGAKLLCARSPHITMGNLLIATNVHHPMISEYFNLGMANSVVCVNAIKSNLQQRLNGCDYDSDAMLVTDDPKLYRAAKENYANFGVPVCSVDPSGRVEYSASAEDLAELDINIAENRIGEIVNLAQFLNSLYWDKLTGGCDRDGLQELYVDICKLAVLSGMEIDKAKRTYNVSAEQVIEELQRYKRKFKLDHNGAVPKFFAFITDNDDAKRSSEAKLNTAMSYIFDAVSTFGKAPQTESIEYSELFVLDGVRNNNGKNTRKKNKILEITKEAQKKIRALNYESSTQGRSEKQYAKQRANEEFRACLSNVSKLLDCDHVYELVLHELDAGENVSEYSALLFAVLCYANDCALLKKLKPPKYPINELIPIDDEFEESDAFSDSEIEYLYGHPHVIGYFETDRRIVLRKKNTEA